MLEERVLSKASEVMLALFPAHLDSCTVPSPSLSPSISFKASALAEGRRKKGSQWRWRSEQEKVKEERGSRRQPIPTFILDDAANNPLYCILIHVIVLS